MGQHTGAMHGNANCRTLPRLPFCPSSHHPTDLPLNSSVLWNLHLLPARPAGSTLDVKKSKHKKMSKFLQVR